MADQPTCPMWMMSFGDCMSLLVTFFVMLIAFTNLEEAKLVETLNAMKGALGAAEKPIMVKKPIEYDSTSTVRGRAQRAKWLTVGELSKILPDAEMAVKRFGRAQVGGPKKLVYVTMFDEGLAFIVHAESVFKPETAEIKGRDYEELWSQVGHFVSKIDNEVRIVCTAPFGSKVDTRLARTAVGMCIERAAVIEEKMRMASGLGSDRFSITGKESEGYGDEVPAERVEIIVLGKRMIESMTPEEIIVRNKWK